MQRLLGEWFGGFLSYPSPSTSTRTWTSPSRVGSGLHAEEEPGAGLDELGGSVRLAGALGAQGFSARVVDVGRFVEAFGLGLGLRRLSAGTAAW